MELDLLQLHQPTLTNGNMALLAVSIPLRTPSAYAQPMGPPAAPARPNGLNYFVSNLSEEEYERRTVLALANCKLDLSNIPAPCRLEDRFETWQIPPNGVAEQLVF